MAVKMEFMVFLVVAPENDEFSILRTR